MYGIFTYIYPLNYPNVGKYINLYIEYLGECKPTQHLRLTKRSGAIVPWKSKLSTILLNDFFSRKNGIVLVPIGSMYGILPTNSPF